MAWRTSSDAGDVNQVCDDMDSLLRDAAKVAATLHGTDCGGPTDYVTHFLALRSVFRVPEQLDELRQQLNDVARLANATRQAQSQARQARFERTLAAVGAVSVPPAIVAAFYGFLSPPVALVASARSSPVRADADG